MKKTEYSSLGLKVNFLTPETVDEFDKLAGKAGACLAEGTNNIVYRVSLAEFRDTFLHGRKESKTVVDGKEVVLPAIKGIDDLTGIARKELPVLKDGKPVVKDGVAVTAYDPEDSEAKYFKRVCAEKGVEPASFQAHADLVAAAIAFDPSATERAPAGPKKLAQKYKDVALQFLTGKKSLSNLNKAFQKSLNKQFSATTVDAAGAEVKLDAEVNVEALGWMCKEYEAAQDVFAKV